MFITSVKEILEHTRTSKLGHCHTYKRLKTILIFMCDNCGKEFKRDKSKMDPKRVSNGYFHVCANCDAKRFAQQKGAERRSIWDLPAGSNLPIGRY